MKTVYLHLKNGKQLCLTPGGAVDSVAQGIYDSYKDKIDTKKEFIEIVGFVDGSYTYDIFIATNAIDGIVIGASANDII